MRTIYKYPVEVTDQFIIEMPIDSEILSLQIDQKTGLPVIWAMVETDNIQIEPRIFAVIGTGNPIPKLEGIGDYDFIGTFQLHNGSFVGHLFETYV
ncbi:DUF7352 domain-containing protein [Dyadobacter sandarakinus]|uniref:DUF7352 domain-containing protein n=1 Tax=Dyadobacter sandarakinus TaxID=2747268 RepID=A0ABX7I124_9BACT|nr:hypothetical protein [Dyadobacter sandarakinus]QRQ99760.1 hypothetical protein HWI92_01910 [Dyadobacter sandarakinus]